MKHANATAEPVDTLPLTELERRLLNDFQHDFPLVPNPFAVLAERLGVSEGDVLASLEALQQRGMISRIGPVFQTHRVGASTLAAMPVPTGRLEAVAQLVSRYAEVNHNYEREHAFNLWFVVTAATRTRVTEVLEEIRATTGLQVLDLPMEESFHIDLGFRLWAC